MIKQIPNMKFWLMTARVLRESFTRNGSRRRSLFISAIVALWMATSLPAAPMAIPISPAASAGLGYMLNRGVNESLWEGLFGVATILLVGSLVIHMWRAGAQMKRHMETKLGRMNSNLMCAAAVQFAFNQTRLLA